MVVIIHETLQKENNGDIEWQDTLKTTQGIGWFGQWEARKTLEGGKHIGWSKAKKEILTIWTMYFVIRTTFKRVHFSLTYHTFSYLQLIFDEITFLSISNHFLACTAGALTLIHVWFVVTLEWPSLTHSWPWLQRPNKLSRINTCYKATKVVYILFLH